LSQQILPLRLRKSFLVIGIVLLVLGFSFFYWASKVSSDYVTTYKNDVNLNSPEGQGALIDAETDQYYYYLVIPYSIKLEPDDFLRVSIAPNLAIGNVYIKLEETPTVCLSEDWLGFKNYYSYDIGAWVYLVASNVQNVTISTTTEVHHYERPQWVYFVTGVVLSSLALVPFFKLRKEPTHVAQKARSS
jgi:hypothetical protein